MGEKRPKTMNKLKKLLKKAKNFFKKQVANSKKRTADRKLDKLYEARLDLGLTMLGVKDKNNGFYRYYTYRWSDSPKESFKKALLEEAKEIGNEKGYGQTLKTAMANSRPPVNYNKWRWILVAVILGYIVVMFIASRQPAKITTPPNKAINQTESVSPNSPQCTTWMMEPTTIDDSNNRWFADGIAEIKDAKTPEDAKAAFNVWLEKTKSHRNLLVAAGRTFLAEDKWHFDATTLPPDGTCANDTIVQLTKEIELVVIGQSKSIIPINAPTNGFNTGVENGIVVGSTTAGISGDMRAIQIDLSDGRMIWILGRCGNIVTTKELSLPHGKTDQVTITRDKKHHVIEKPKVTPTTPKLTPKSSNPKDYKQPGDDNKKDSGTGTKPKATVSTPAESAPPTVTTSKSGGEGVVDTPTNKPGSETGTTAKGASPAPSTPSAPKPNEGGSNDGVVTD